MGGNGPLVILDDADIDAAVRRDAHRLLPQRRPELHRRRARARAPSGPRRVRRAAARGRRRREVRLGDPLDRATTMGPLNNERTAAKTERHVRDAVERGATLVTGGRRAAELGSALFFEPTILDQVTETMAIAREETFGPVVPITTIDDEDEALAIVDGSRYGLLTAVFTQDLARGLRFAESARAGWVNINEGTNYWESHLPFGGRAGSQSGLGRVGGRFSIERLTELKTIVIESLAPERRGLEASDWRKRHMAGLPGAGEGRRHRRGDRRQLHGLAPRAPRLARHRAAREGHAPEPRRLDRPRLELHLPDRPLQGDDRVHARQRPPVQGARRVHRAGRHRGRPDRGADAGADAPHHVAPSRGASSGASSSRPQRGQGDRPVHQRGRSSSAASTRQASASSTRSRPAR